MSKLRREIISRAAMLILGGGLLFCGWKCFAAASAIRNDPANSAATVDRRSDGAGLPVIAGAVLCLLGAPFALASIVPTALFAKIMGPPKISSLYDRPEPSQSMKYWF